MRFRWLRRARSPATLVTLGLASFAANAQAPLLPRTAPAPLLGTPTATGGEPRPTPAPPVTGPPRPAESESAQGTSRPGESSQSTSRFNVEPGRPLLEHRGSGSLGPYHYDESERWLDFGILIQTEYIHNSPSDGPSSQQLFFRRLRPTLMGGMDDWQGILQMDFGAGQDGTASATTVRWVNFQY